MATLEGVTRLGGLKGVLDLVTLTVTGTPVEATYLLGGCLELSRAEPMGVIFRRPVLR